jgi:MFS family permease
MNELMLAIRYGFGNSLSPFFLLIFLVFSIHVSFFGKTKKLVMGLAVVYLFSVFFIISSIISGKVDFLFFDQEFNRLLWGSVFGVAFGLFVVGAIHFFDWRKCAVEDFSVAMFKVRLPSFLKKNEFEKREEEMFSFKANGVKALRTFALFFVTFILGVLVTLFLILQPQEYYIVVSYSFMAFKGYGIFAFFFIFLYMISALWPVVMFSIFAIIALGSEKLKKRIVKSISIYKVVYSALFLATSFAFLYLALERL